MPQDSNSIHTFFPMQVGNTVSLNCICTGITVVIKSGGCEGGKILRADLFALRDCYIFNCAEQVREVQTNAELPQPESDDRIAVVTAELEDIFWFMRRGVLVITMPAVSFNRTAIDYIQKNL